jgi:hypothetical protein
VLVQHTAEAASQTGRSSACEHHAGRPLSPTSIIEPAYDTVGLLRTLHCKLFCRETCRPCRTPCITACEHRVAPPLHLELTFIPVYTTGCCLGMSFWMLCYRQHVRHITRLASPP